MKKVLVSLLVGVTLCGGLFGCSNTVSQEDYNKVVEEKETLVKNNKDLVKDKQELQAKIDSAKDYFELDENEKVLVDQKIEEVNNATEEQKEAEKKAKEEEERAKKEAEEKAEAERKAAEEEANRQAEEEQRKQLEYGNAIKCVQDYVDIMSFSRQRLISQLEYDGYSNEAAIYAVDNIRVDWNSECAQCAQDYLDFTAFSRQGLYDQLAYEGFSDEQIQYGLSQVGY